MLYAIKDENGFTTSISTTPSNPEQPEVTEVELIDFLSTSGSLKSFQRLLNLLDSDTIRVLEDLVDLLVSKNLIMFTELPIEAQKKLGERKIIRKQLQKDHPIIIDDEII